MSVPPDKDIFSVGDVSIISIPSDPPIAGESYTLECSTGGSEGTFQWLGPPDGRTLVVSSGYITVSDMTTTSQLQFSRIGQSNSGSYACSATTDGFTFSSEPVMINVNGNVSPHIHSLCMMCF